MNTRHVEDKLSGDVKNLLPVGSRFRGYAVEKLLGSGGAGAVWLLPCLAILAFLGFLAAFAFELFSYRHQVVDWAERDLAARANLAAANLLEPLRTQDFPRVRELGEELLADGYRLTVLAANGRGRVFDAQAAGGADATSPHAATCRCGDFLVRLSVPPAQVLRSFRRARRSFILAALLGMTGVFLFFVVIWRQRVRLAEMARVERFRRDFIADVSHEIKTPLTGILGAVDLLDEEAEGERRKVLFSLIRKESQRLNRLVQQILDLARLEREGQTIHRAETDLAALAHEVAQRFGVAFAAEAASSPRPLCRVDPQLVEEALSNLVVNAQRHSGSSEIAVSLTCDGGVARIAVEDHGVGIPPEHVARIFERFHRVDSARAAETGGAGLGLAIVRRIARLHGGDVTYRPAVPHGSVFTFEVPL